MSGASKLISTVAQAIDKPVDAKTRGISGKEADTIQYIGDGDTISERSPPPPFDFRTN